MTTAIKSTLTPDHVVRPDGKWELLTKMQIFSKQVAAAKKAQAQIK